MGINFNDWMNRVASRSDLTGRLTHLTKPMDVDISGMTFDQINLCAVDNLIKILKDNKIYGSTTESGYIVGDTPAVCLQDTPLYALIQNVEHERERRVRNPREKLRYCGVGLSFVKPDVHYYCGGRPAIYERTEAAKNFISEENWWRIVANEYRKSENDEWDIIDWTHEREWRVPGEMDVFGMGYVHIILYNPSCVRYFLEKCPKEIIEKTYGITTLTSVLI